MGKIYFVSDLHLGVPGRTTSEAREQSFVRWLRSIREEADCIYLLGDLFDFYFEYKTVVPKGYVRLLGELASIADSGVEMHFFTGNHDMWIFKYFEEELGITTHRAPVIHHLQGKTLYIGHGDGLGPGDRGYKVLKQIFNNKVCQWLFERIHPNLGIGIANYWSRKSRYSNPDKIRFEKEREWLVAYCNTMLGRQPDIDYFLLGHRHLPIIHTLENGISKYVNTGEWLYSQSYAYLEDGQIHLSFHENADGKVFG